MKTSTLTADYVIAGAGAVGLAFADTLLRESTASLIIVDRRSRPGGHWNDAYPFVRLHGPSATYGVDSLPLGTGRIDGAGLNQGLHELASGPEICAYFERVMDERLLASGRVRYLPSHEIGVDGKARSLLDGSLLQLVARRRWVDATQADTQVPATHPPRFAVAEGVRCVTPGELAQLPALQSRGHVIVGGGKTAMDVALWLLAQGVDPDTISWIRPRDSWLLNRANVQPTLPFAEQTLAAMTAELEAARDAASVSDLFVRLEQARLLQRIDTAVQPTMYRCAIVSDAELRQLRRIRNVVRLGRVLSIETDRIVLEHGESPTAADRVHVHCSAAGLPRGPAQPVFQASRIVPQYLRRCSPCFSAALVAHIEARFENDDQKNALAQPVPVPEVPLDWLRMHLHSARNQRQWSQHGELRNWLRRSRLEAYTALFEQAAALASPNWTTLQLRLNAARQPALQRMTELLESEPRGLSPTVAARALPQLNSRQRRSGTRKSLCLS